MAVTLNQKIDKNKAIAASLISGEVIKNAKVIQSGILDSKNPIKSGIEEHEQKGVNAQNNDHKK